jgi:transcription-repair coupling factor (superfamily II helicase)
MPNLQKIITSRAPLTLASVPAGFTPLLLADLTRAAKSSALFIATDDAAMRMVADTVPFFAPELEILQFPSWDCLPYDRASPSLAITAQRIAALQAMLQPARSKRLILTTIGAVIQRVLTPFRIRQTGERLAPGRTISRDSLAEMLMADGYFRVDTVAEAGEFAIRGGIVDLIPAGSELGLRLDFFGDEIETMRYFDPQDQRSTGKAEFFDILPAVETLMDEDSIRRFRTSYRERFGATSTGDPLYQAVSDGRRLSGMDHWLPLFEERMETLFDHLADDCLIIRDAATPAAAEARFETIADYYDNRVRAASSEPGSYRPLPSEMLYLNAKELNGQFKSRAAHLLTPFHQPDSATVIDFGIDSARDFAPERAQKTNIYQSVADHLKALQKDGKKAIIASYSIGSRDRLKGLLADHNAPALTEADNWQSAQGIAAKGQAAMIVLPIDHGFTSADVSLISEQDMLGDRLVRRQRRKKSADAFLAELAALTPGDLVVHMEHGIGRYEGLVAITVGKSPHDCVALTYSGGDKLFVPVENIDVLSRYGSDSEHASLDKLGGEAWQRRKSKPMNCCKPPL